MNLFELRAAFEAAEKAYTAEYRRAQWMERRMMHAQTEDEYNELAAQLEKQEAIVKDMGLKLMRARYAYTAGEMQA